MHCHTAKPDEIRSFGGRSDNSRKGSLPARGLHYAWRRFRRWIIENEAIRHLESLDDSRLEDLGIERREITLAVRGRLENPANLRAPGFVGGDANSGHHLAA